MKTFIRNTPTVSEYWDDEKKRIISIPLGVPKVLNDNLIDDIVEDIFEMLEYKEAAEAMEEQRKAEEAAEAERIEREKELFNEMTVAELKAYAKEHSIKLPAKVKKADIINILVES